MTVEEIFYKYGEDVINLLETSTSRLQLVQRYAAFGEKKTANDRFILWILEEAMKALSLSHERLSDSLFLTRKEMKNRKEENTYFKFSDDDEITQISEQEARQLGMLDDIGDHYENDDI